MKKDNRQSLADRITVAPSSNGSAPRPKDQPAPAPAERPGTAPLLWGLRLWILAALVIIGFSLASYLLNHLFVK